MAYIYSNTDKTVRMLAQASGTESRDTGSKDAPIPGDQIAHELDAVGYYQHSVRWGKLYRLNDEAQREILAKFMEDSILNGWVGYDTNHRNTFERALADVAYDPNRIAWACSTDCSMLAYEAVKAATGVDLNAYADPLYPIGKHPHVQSFDYYMERILPLNGVGVTVYTVSNYVGGVLRRSDTVVADDPAQSKYLYESAYDDKTALLYDYNYGVAIGQDVPNKTLAEAARAADNRRAFGPAGEAAIAANLTVNVGEQYLSYLTSSDNLIRGDILRTRTPPAEESHGHIAVWI